MFLRATLVWLAILVLANLNGAMRELLLVSSVGTTVAHIVSSLILGAVVAGVAWMTVLWIRPHSKHQALGVGVWWLALTLAFEFLAGHFLFGKPWSLLLADYNLLAGRVWVIVPIVTLISPLWAWTRRLHSQ
jgi:hypothetical protein